MKQANILTGKTEIQNVSSLAFKLLLIIFWMRNTGVNFLLYFYKRVPIIGMTGDVILPVVVVSLILLALPYMLKHIKWQDILFYLVCMATVLISMLLWWKNVEYIEKHLWQMLGLTFPLYFLGICYDHEDTKKLLYICSLIGVAVMFVYQLREVNTGEELAEDNMFAAYNCLPSVLFLINGAFERKKILPWLAAVAGIVLSFVFGTRGPILAILLFILIRIVGNILHSKSAAAKVITTVVCGFVAYYLLATDVITQWSIVLSELFEEIGFSNRVFEFYLEGEIAESEGRELKAAIISQAISGNLFTGLGIMGDRVLLGGAYVHNIALEIWCNFGVVFGTLALGGIILAPLSAVWNNRNRENRYFVIMLATMVFTKLMLSNSYLIEPYLFFMLGVAVHEIRSKRA